MRYWTLLGAYGPKAASHRLVGMVGIIQTALMLILVGYVCVGACGYIAFPDTVKPNILESFPEDDGFVQVAR